MRHVKAIETERLVLRRLRIEDGERISTFTSDYAVAAMTMAIPYPNPTSAAEGWVLITLARQPLGRDHVFAIDLKREGLIGVIGAHQREGARHEVGYWLGKPFWGEGLATEALGALLSKARARRAGIGPFRGQPRLRPRAGESGLCLYWRNPRSVLLGARQVRTVQAHGFCRR